MYQFATGVYEKLEDMINDIKALGVAQDGLGVS